MSTSMKNILLLKGSGIYDAIRTYIDELAKGFRRLGYNTIILDFEESNRGERLEWILDTYPLYAVLIVNNAIDSLRKRVELPGTVCVNYYCDHPMYHAGELERLGENWMVLNLDRKHSAYLKKYFPKFHAAEFVPLSGTPSDGIRPYEKRKIDVLFTGSYHVPQSMLHIPKEGEDFARMIYLAVWNLLTGAPHMTLDEALERVFAGYEVVVDRDTFHKVVVELKSIEGGMRCFFREQLICSLLKAGIRVDVFGDGWEKLECEGRENLVIHKGGAQAASRALGDSKIALNIMPWFKAGIQERVVAGMLSGAVALTDTSEYIEEEFTDGEDIVLYHLEHIEEAAEKVRWLLEHGQEAERIAQAGRARAEEKHTWEVRAERIAELIEREHNSNLIGTEERGNALDVWPETESLSSFIEDVGVTFRKKTDVLQELWLNGYLEMDDVEHVLAQFRAWNDHVGKKRGYGLLDEEEITIFYRRIRESAGEVIQKNERMEVLGNLLEQMWEDAANKTKNVEPGNLPV